MKTMIVGGAGYIGSALTPRLQERGYDVSVVDLLWFGNHLPDGTEVIKKNAMNLTEDDLRDYDQVVFIAGLSNDPMAEFSPSMNFVENGALPAYLAYVAKNAGVKRFVHGGSCSVYGYTVNELYDETSPAVSAYPYGISKLQGEFSALQLADDNYSVIGFRKGTVSGYSPRMRFDLIVNTMFMSAVRDKEITVSNPAIWRPILALQDAVSAYVRAVEAPERVSGVFNIASGNYTVGEVADYVQAGVRDSLGINPKITINHIQDFRNYKVTSDKAERMLSFKAKHTVEDIISELAEHLEEFGDFSDSKYYNIKTFKQVLADTAS